MNLAIFGYCLIFSGLTLVSYLFLVLGPCRCLRWKMGRVEAFTFSCDPCYSTTLVAKRLRIQIHIDPFRSEIKCAKVILTKLKIVC